MRWFNAAAIGLIVPNWAMAIAVLHFHIAEAAPVQLLIVTAQMYCLYLTVRWYHKLTGRWI